MTTTPFEVTVARLVVPVGEEDHVIGPRDAPVTLVEYGDYQCPYCRAAHAILQDVMRLRRESLRFVFRHFPLANVHPYAELAAQVAEAAGARQRFWPMHDWIYEHQPETNPRQLIVGAEELGLPSDEIAREVGANRYLDRVRRDFVGGVRSGVNGTPTFFVNGVRHDGGHALEELLEAVDDAAEAS